jgi:HEAT repeat protein
MSRHIAILTTLAALSVFTLGCAGGSGGPLNDLMEEVRLDDPLADRTYIQNQNVIEVPESIPALIEYLSNDESPKVNAWAALILGRIGDPQAVPALTAALSNTDADTRNRAVGALSLIGETEAEGAFIEALQSGTRDARITALVELEKTLSINAIPAIADTARANDGMVSKNAIDTLGGMGDASATAPLVELALSTNLDNNLRRAAIMNLHRMTIPEASAGLQEVISGLAEQEGADELLQLARDQG